jgi:hypothetical protein
MRCVVSGNLPSNILLSSAARILVLGLTGVALAGCAATRSPQYAGAPVPRPVSEQQWKVEIEDDGKPAQAPPVRRMRPEEDDPTQPWSPNYGRKTPLPVAPSPSQGQPRSWPKPVEASHSAPIDDREADAIIARAVNAHEMRKP